MAYSQQRGDDGEQPCELHDRRERVHDARLHIAMSAAVHSHAEAAPRVVCAPPAHRRRRDCARPDRAEAGPRRTEMPSRRVLLAVALASLVVLVSCRDSLRLVLRVQGVGRFIAPMSPDAVVGEAVPAAVAR